MLISANKTSFSFDFVTGRVNRLHSNAGNPVARAHNMVGTVRILDRGLLELARFGPNRHQLVPLQRAR